MKILLSGSHGLIGTQLMRSLHEKGHEVKALGRDFTKDMDFNDIDAVIHLAGESIAKGRWTTEKKKRIEESRVAGTTLLSQQIAESPHKPRVFITASAIGYYGERGNEILDECSSAGTGFLAEVCRKWEAVSLPARKAGIRTVNIRTGIVLSEKGGALSKMLPPFKIGAGGIIGNGKQFMSWISLHDLVEAITFLINDDESVGAINLVSPKPITNHEFTKTLGHVLHRPTIMPLPAFAAKIMFGEMAEALLLSSTKVIPKKLMEAGFKYKHEDLREALEDILR
ncbi:Epimerase family protein [Pontiella desulfatans]|uniref:Epimerase family protein n=1 Tax=Pontiella desulfatans TaxID=2750659 RepID=A0A6C2UC82_PONDE|nr:TIGR01777 family oxidoreductase [Pontiella desulfatans]VGO16964.1 Epimerase family protein [Pontiella desulfatans]